MRPTNGAAAITASATAVASRMPGARRTAERAARSNSDGVAWASCTEWFGSGAAIKLGEGELAMAECLGGGEAAVGGAHHHLDQCITGGFDRHIAAEHA
jgi:hypothetical protein